jgi:DNA-binding NtrC family response regulator
VNQAAILIVDDEPGVRESLRVIFAKDFRLSEAKTSEECIQKVQEERPDVILLDIVMPGTDGLKVLKHGAHGFYGQRVWSL